MKKSLSFPILLGWVLGQGFQPGATGQVAIQNARLELVELKRHFRDMTDIQAARGTEFGLLDFEVEFDDSSSVGQVSLQTPDDLYTNLAREGDVFRFEEYVGVISGRFLGTYTIIAGLQAGGTMEFEFVIEDFGDRSFPEIEFPADGVDGLDAEDLEADWRSSGDSNRVDLFEIDNPSSNTPPLLGDRLEKWRSISENQDLVPLLFANRLYELWVGETKIETLDADFNTEFWYTSSLYQRFSTGPDPREDLGGFNVNEFVTSATAGFERKRYGNTSTATVDRVTARLVGNAVEEAEVARIQGPMDNRILAPDALQPLIVVEGDTIFEREVAASAGQSVLFLMEFRITALVGSEIAQVDSPLPFPQITAPLSNASGLGSSIQVTWGGVAGADAYEVGLRSLSGVFSSRSGSLAQGARNHTFNGVPAGGDFELEVAAKSDQGSVSKTSILVSTRPQGDANADGSATGTDLFGFAARWRGRVPTPADFASPSGITVLDLNGDETLGPHDVFDFLELTKAN